MALVSPVSLHGVCCHRCHSHCMAPRVWHSVSVTAHLPGVSHSVTMAAQPHSCHTELLRSPAVLHSFTVAPWGVTRCHCHRAVHRVSLSLWSRRVPRSVTAAPVDCHTESPSVPGAGAVTQCYVTAWPTGCHPLSPSLPAHSVSPSVTVTAWPTGCHPLSLSLHSLGCHTPSPCRTLPSATPCTSHGWHPLSLRTPSVSHPVPTGRGAPPGQHSRSQQPKSPLLPPHVPLRGHVPEPVPSASHAAVTSQHSPLALINCRCWQPLIAARWEGDGPRRVRNERQRDGDRDGGCASRTLPPPAACGRAPPAGQGTVPGVGLRHARMLLSQGPGLTQLSGQLASPWASWLATSQLVSWPDRQTDSWTGNQTGGLLASQSTSHLANEPARQSTSQLAS